MGTNFPINKQIFTSLNIKNITDKKYIPATDNMNGDFNNSGRTIELGLTYKF
jgi:outer membrane receptor protein involved in Fe transport